MMVEIPTSIVDSNYEQRMVLAGVECLLRLVWNQRTGRWHLDIEDAEGNLLVAGRPVVVNWPLLYTETDERIPPVELWAIDTSPSPADPGLEDLGIDQRVALMAEDGTDA